MEDLRARAHVPGWWQDYGDILSEPVQALIERSKSAPGSSGTGWWWFFLDE